MSPRQKRQSPNYKSEEKTTPSNVESGPVPSQFSELFTSYQRKIDEKNDRYERLVKLSRDITIESKRLIFQLHRNDSNADQSVGLEEVSERIKNLSDTKWRKVAEELYNEDHHQYLQAYSPGLQEYIEALAFHYYLDTGRLIRYDTVVNSLRFDKSQPLDNDGKCSDNTLKSASCSDDTKQEQHQFLSDNQAMNLDLNSTTTSISEDDHNGKEVSRNRTESDRPPSRPLCLLVPPVEFMLGVADLTGELMRLAINTLGRDPSSRVPLEVAEFIRGTVEAFTRFPPSVHREFSRKLTTMRQSCRKVEAACYMLKVRGSEIPKHLLVHSINDGFRSLPAGSDMNDDNAEIAIL